MGRGGEAERVLVHKGTGPPHVHPLCGAQLHLSDGEHDDLPERAIDLPIIAKSKARVLWQFACVGPRNSLG